VDTDSVFEERGRTDPKKKIDMLCCCPCGEIVSLLSQ